MSNNNGDELKLGDPSKESFLQNYMKFVKWQESPEDFHLWTALTLVGAATLRKVYYDQVYFRVYPNLYTGVVAESAICRKTTAARVGFDLFNDAFRDKEGYKVIKGKITPQALYDMCSGKKAQFFLEIDELNSFFTQDMRALGIVEMLTELYTCPDHREYITVTHSCLTLDEVFVTVIGTAVPSYLQKATADVFQEGLIGRFSFVHREERKASFPRIKRVVNVKYLYELKHILTEQLLSIADKSGEIDMDEEAGKDFDAWCGRIQRKGGDTNSVATGFLGRKEDYCIKYAIILALAKSPFSKGLPIIDAPTMKAAQLLVAESEQSLQTIFAESPGGDVLSKQGDVENLLMSRGKVSRTVLSQKFYRRIPMDQLDLIVRSLRLAKVMYERKEGKMTMYYFVPTALRETPYEDGFEKKVLAEYELGIQQNRFSKL